MNIEKRTQEIRECIKSCGRNGYLKSEILPEMLELQRELVELTFNKEHADIGSLRLWDVVNHFTQLSEEHNNTALSELTQFRDDCKKIGNLIRAEISGNWGEEKAFSFIDRIREPHILLKNVALNCDGVRTEIDGVVLTRRGVFIVEVKNTKKNIFIDENGDFYRVGEYTRWDSNVGEKLQARKKILHNVLETAGFDDVNIYSIVVFTNNRIEIQNKSHDITTCFLAQLPYIIAEQAGDDSFDDENLSKAADVIDERRNAELFPLNFNAEQVKQNFAVLMAKLEAAAEVTEPEENENHAIIINPIVELACRRTRLKRIFSVKNLKAAGNAAAIIAVALTAVANFRNNY